MLCAIRVLLREADHGFCRINALFVMMRGRQNLPLCIIGEVNSEQAVIWECL